MELRVGYKKTEIGEIPKDWDINTVESVSERVGDVDHRMPQPAEYGIPYIMTGDFYGINGMNFSNAKKISIEDFNLLSRKIKPEKGDIIFARYASVGAVRYVKTEKPFLVSYSCVIFKPAASCNALYLYYAFQSAYMQKQVNLAVNTGTQKNVGIDSLKKFLVPLPQYPEQSAIAAALSDTDTYIAALQKLIAKKRTIKQGAMQELLTGKLRLPGFKGKWQVVNLEDVAEIIDPHPSHRAPREEEYGIPFVGIGDISIDGTVNTKSVRLVSEDIFTEHQFRYNLKDSLLGIGRVASLGKVVKLCADIGKFAVSPTMAVLRFFDLEPNFAFQYMNSAPFQEQFSAMSNGSTRQSVGMNVIRKLHIVKPERSEQKTIATILSEMDAEIDALTAKLNKAQYIKQGMMSELLTGRIRLI